MSKLAVDCETRGLKWWKGDEGAFVITVSDAEADEAYDVEYNLKHFESRVDDVGKLVMHNAPFDVHHIREVSGIDLLETHEIDDTLVLAQLCWPEAVYGEGGGFGLKNLAVRRLSSDADFEERELTRMAAECGVTMKTKGAYEVVYRAYPDVLLAYAMKDTRYTYDLHDLLLQELVERPGLKRVADLERAVQPILIRAEHTGIATDPTTVLTLRKEYEEKRHELHKELSKELGDAALGGTDSQEALAEALLSNGVPLNTKTNSGRASTSQYALEPYAESHPVVKRFLKYRSLEKMLSTYIMPMLDSEVVHPSFQQNGARTGRMSCRSPNLQNLPRDVALRDVFVAREGHTLIVSDYEGIEPRLLAHYLGPAGAEYRKLLAEGHDAYAYVASQVYGGDMAKYNKKHPLRQRCKSAQLAIVYGAGGPKLGAMLGLDPGEPLTADDWVVKRGYKKAGEPSHREGAQLAKDIKDAIPGYKRLAQRVKEKIEGDGYITTLAGRENRVPKSKSYVGMNALIQGGAADCMKAGLVAVERELKAEGLPAQTLLVVHDEVVVEAPDEIAPQVAVVVQRALESVTDEFALTIPLASETGMSKTYGAAK